MSAQALKQNRPAYYDRSPSSYLASYQGSPAPHAQTTRVSVTVASAKKHRVEALVLTLERYTAATTSGTYYALCNVTPSGGSSSIVMVVDSNSNTTLQRTYAPIISGMNLYAGDALTIDSYDGSTGGTISFTLAYKATLYDA